MKNLPTITLISVYLIAIAVLTQFGFNSYFNIPNSFVESSIQQNIVYFFQLYQIGLAIAVVIKLWMWVGLIVLLLLTIFLYWSNYRWRMIMSIMAVVFLAFLLLNSYNFGNFLAKNDTTFYVLSSSCPNIEKDKMYIVPSSYQDKAIAVSIDKNTKKMDGSVSLIDISNPLCSVKQENIGKIIK